MATSPLKRAAGALGSHGPGRYLLSKMVSRIAPYFLTIRPQFERIEPGYVVATMADRRAVQNHIGAVHAIAMCNIAEFVGGTCTDLSVPDDMRWIPVEMTVRYQKLAHGTLRATCDMRDIDITEPGNVVAPVSVVNEDGVEVFSADITMRVSPKKKRN